MVQSMACKELDTAEQLNNSTMNMGFPAGSCSSGADNKQINYVICLRYLCSEGIREGEKELWGSVCHCE